MTDKIPENAAGHALIAGAIVAAGIAIMLGLALSSPPRLNLSGLGRAIERAAKQIAESNIHVACIEAGRTWEYRKCAVDK